MLTLQFLLPFTLPLFIVLLSSYYPLLTSLFALLLLFTFPLILLKCWQCEPLPPSELKDALDQVAARARFKHGGFKRWTLMQGRLTAGIIGIFPSIRYVLFSDTLLSRLSPSALSAILAHEIGHSYWRHLLLIPFLFVGVFLFTDYLMEFFPFKNDLNPIIWIFLLVLLIRLIFGFYSRLFERQADLHGLKLDQPLSWMIEALEQVSYYSFGAANKKDWLHGSLQSRIDFLQQVQTHPSLAVKHHQKTLFFVGLYFIFLTLLCSHSYGLA